MHEHGLSHLIEHMAFKGTRRRSARQIAEDIENVGGEINAATSVEFTSYTARVLGENVDVALDVLGDILTDSVFDEAELAREKGVILQEYAAVEDTPDDLVYDAFMETAFAGQAIGRPILGAAGDHPLLRRRHDPRLHGARIRPRADGARGGRRRAITTPIVEAAERQFGALSRVTLLEPRSSVLYGRRAAHGAPARTGQRRARLAGLLLQGPGVLRHAYVRPCARRRPHLAALA